jgi:predicted nucleic acid-binding protein
MPYLLDSDIVIRHLAEDAAITSLIRSIRTNGLSISVITYIEVWEGLLRSDDVRTAQAQFEQLLRDVAVTSVSLRIAQRCAEVRYGLRRQGKQPRRRALDLIVAATALEEGLTLVTGNIDDYRDIPGLKLFPAPPPSRSSPQP